MALCGGGRGARPGPCGWLVGCFACHPAHRGYQRDGGENRCGDLSQRINLSKTPRSKNQPVTKEAIDQLVIELRALKEDNKTFYDQVLQRSPSSNGSRDQKGMSPRSAFHGKPALECVACLFDSF